jgi:hypothetical protein
MHHQHAQRALPCGFFVFVGPATVVSHRLAAEVAFAGFEVGIVDQNHCDLAVQVDTFEVVPAALGRHHAVAYEHQRRVRDRHCGRAVHGRSYHNLFALAQCLTLAVEVECQRRRAHDLTAP